jgi:hypothetical protein
VLVSVVMLFPLVLHLGARFPAAPGNPLLERAQVYWAGPQTHGGIPASPADPMLQAWQVAWDAHALAHHPGSLWNSNTFWPLRKSLAFSDALVGYAPAGLIGSGRHAALVRYDLLLIFSFAFAAFGAYALARALGASVAGAAVAGAAFGFSPWRIAQIGHLHVLSSGGVALSLALLVHGYRRSSARAVAAGWIVAAWQVTLGFTLGLQLLYLLLVLACIAIVARRRRLWPERPVLIATLAGGALLVATAIVFARPYLAVLHDYPEAKRTLDDVKQFSPRFGSFAAAPRHDVLWGALTSHPRSRLTWPEEQTLFPGLLVLVLAGYCIRRGRAVFAPRLIAGLAIGVVVTALLALGVGPGRYMPYRLLYEFAPGWNGVRTSDRIFTLTTLGLALLAAGGLTVLAVRVRTRARHVIAVAAVLVVLVEGIGAPPLLSAPAPVKARLQSPIFFLPSTDIVDAVYMLWSVDGFPQIVNGTSGFRPNYITGVRDLSLLFPGPHTTAEFRGVGVRTIVLDRRLVGITPWRVLVGRHARGLPVKEQEVGPWVIYRLAG